MFCGARTNTFENRAVRQTALGQSHAMLIVHGQNAIEHGHAVLDAMGGFTDRLGSDDWTGATAMHRILT